MAKRLDPLRLVRLLLFVMAFAVIRVQAQREGIELPPFPIRAEILLVGTFHFQDAGLDEYKPKFKVDVLSSKRQEEIAMILDAFFRYRPTRIAIEWPAEKQSDLDTTFRKYLAGQLGPEANEIYQLGFRLGKRLGHQQLFAIDARERWYDTNVSTESLIQRAQQNNQLDLLKRGREWIAYFDSLSERDDQLKVQMSLFDFIAYLNSPERLRLTLGRYLVGQIEVGGNGEYLGADMRTAWYNRNLRIFSNIQRLPLTNNERILVIVGQGHVPILRHLVENAPEYKLVPVSKYLRGSRRSRKA